MCTRKEYRKKMKKQIINLVWRKWRLVSSEITTASNARVQERQWQQQMVRRKRKKKE